MFLNTTMNAYSEGCVGGGVVMVCGVDERGGVGVCGCGLVLIGGGVEGLDVGGDLRGWGGSVAMSGKLV